MPGRWGEDTNHKTQFSIGPTGPSFITNRGRPLAGPPLCPVATEPTMLPDQPSKTLLRPAILRAAHQLIDRPLILDDPLAVGLVPEATEAAITAQIPELGSPHLKLLRSAFVLRSRFAEDCIANAVTRGVSQLVVLGAGLETYPWRQPTHSQGLRIFITDHPASAQDAKRVRAAKGWRDPDNVVHFGLDLERRRLVQDLSRHGFSPETPAIFTMLGLSQYLTAGTIEHIAHAVASCASSSQLVMSFNPPPDDLCGLDQVLAQESPTRASALSEPWLFRPSYPELARMLELCGMALIKHLSPEAAQQRYFSRRADGLRAPVFEQLLEAVKTDN